MDAKTIEGVLSYIPISLIAIIVTALLKFSISSVKHIVSTMHQEMVETNQEIKERLKNLEDIGMRTAQDVVQIKALLGSFITVERHYADTRSMNRDVSEMRERVAKIEGRVTP